MVNIPYLQGFIHPKGGCLGFLPSTVLWVAISVFVVFFLFAFFRKMFIYFCWDSTGSNHLKQIQVLWFLCFEECPLLPQFFAEHWLPQAEVPYRLGGEARTLFCLGVDTSLKIHRLNPKSHQNWKGMSFFRKTSTGWWVPIFFMFTPICGKGRLPFWLILYFSKGLVQPPTSPCLWVQNLHFPGSRDLF